MTSDQYEIVRAAEVLQKIRQPPKTEEEYNDALQRAATELLIRKYIYDLNHRGEAMDAPRSLPRIQQYLEVDENEDQALQDATLRFLPKKYYRYATPEGKACSDM